MPAVQDRCSKFFVVWSLKLGIIQELADKHLRVTVAGSRRYSFESSTSGAFRYILGCLIVASDVYTRINHF